MAKEKWGLCIELMVQGGLKRYEIAKKLNVDEDTITNWKKNPEFAAELDRQMRLRFGDYAGMALNAIIDLAQNAESGSVRLQAAKDLLDRAGYKPEDKVQVDGTLDTEKTKLDDLIRQMRGGD